MKRATDQLEKCNKPCHTVNDNKVNAVIGHVKLFICSFIQYSISVCSQPEVASDGISDVHDIVDPLTSTRTQATASSENARQHFNRDLRLSTKT